VRSGNRRPIESAAPVESGTSPRTACLERRPVGIRFPPVPRSPSARRVFARSGTPPIHLDLDLQKRGEGRKRKETLPMGLDGEGTVGGGEEAEDGRALNILWRK